ncbi:MAG: secondary thiamine-phosphate synthase enzyme YjbQ [Lentimicrobiaceae bacterium]|nr:secondary thiamine-phosphate synthase enzyme YjbQ [Lentimicrobiaceae bacterium]
MPWQKIISLPPYPRGIHLITREIMTALPVMPEVGLLHLFIQHTSAALALNENADPDVRRDLNMALDRMAPDGASWYTHILEGKDDMPAHIKAVLTGSSLSIPIHNGQLAMGTWQGIFLCEFRDQGGSRKIVLTLLP